MTTINCGYCGIEFKATKNARRHKSNGSTQDNYCSVRCRILERIQNNDRVSAWGLSAEEVFGYLRDSEWMREQYVQNQRSTTDIGNILGVSRDTVMNWMKRHSVPMRSTSEASSLVHNTDKQKAAFRERIQKAQQREGYWDNLRAYFASPEAKERMRQQALDAWADPQYREKMSVVRSAETKRRWQEGGWRLKCDATFKARFRPTLTNCAYCNTEFRTAPHRIAKSRNLFCRKECQGKWYSENTAGVNSHSWRGGTIRYRGANWREVRRVARKRDGYKCQICGIKQSASIRTWGKKLNVHHIKPFREFGYIPGENSNYLEANQLENLITLCCVCHKKVEHGTLPLPPRE